MLHVLAHWRCLGSWTGLCTLSQWHDLKSSPAAARDTRSLAVRHLACQLNVQPLWTQPASASSLPDPRVHG